MRIQAIALAFALAFAAGCDREPERTPGAARVDSPPTASQPQPSKPSEPQATTPTTPAPPASTGATASQEEKKEGTNPVQGQVDPKQAEQQQDFKQKGDAAGPKSPETAPKPGS